MPHDIKGALEEFAAAVVATTRAYGGSENAQARKMMDEAIDNLDRRIVAEICRLTAGK